MNEPFRVSIGADYECVKSFGKYFKKGHVYEASFHGALQFYDVNEGVFFYYNANRFNVAYGRGHFIEHLNVR